MPHHNQTTRASFYHHLAAAKLDMLRGHIIGVNVTYDTRQKRTIEVLHPQLGNICYYSEADEPPPTPHSANDTDWGWLPSLTANLKQGEQ